MGNHGVERRCATMAGGAVATAGSARNLVRRIGAIVCVAFVLCLPSAAHAESPATPPRCIDETEAGPLQDSTSPPIADDADTGATAPPALKTLPRMALDDAVCVLGSPVHWGGAGWVIAGGAIAGVVIVGAFADTDVRQHVLTHQSPALDDLTRIVEPFGSWYSIGVLGAFGVVGLVLHDADARDTAIDGVLASLLASGIITPSLKLVIGRIRPNETSDPLAFQPFRGGNDLAMPSGHATQAFAVASVISAHSDHFWVSASAYTLASLVAFARVYHNAHWTSDVVAGALIGTLVGRTVVAVNNRIRVGDRSVHVSFSPIFGKNQRGAGVTIVF
jgi:hypothetical protein